jgi:exopolysaccharide biosynthesis WecB/TagA/CpsF family protein
MQKFFNYKLAESLDAVTLDGASKVVNCLNPHSFAKALDDKDFRTALENSDVLLPDGEGICMSLRRWRGVRVAKIAGDDLHRYLLSLLSQRRGKVYYMGSTEKVLNLIVERLGREHPEIVVRTLSPSFCDELGEEESQEIVNDINAFAPDVLFVSMTAPKQEKWVERYKSLLCDVKVTASIGAVFDFYAGTVRRAPQWAVRLKVEWLFRLLKEPRRMWERNFVSTPRYLKWVRKHRDEM